MNVLIINNYPVIRKGFAYILQTELENINILEADTMEYAGILTQKEKIDIALVDMLIPESDVKEFISDSRKQGGETRYIMTSVSSAMDAESVMSLNVEGMLGKDVCSEEIVYAIKAVSNNKKYYGAFDSTIVRTEILTPREQEVLKLVKVGMTNAQIGKELFISESTAKKHVSSILSKLNLKHRVELAIS